MQDLTKSKFNPYEKIPESWNHWQIDDAAYRLFDKIDWVVTEKVHGANLCFTIAPTGIRCAKRKEYISENDAFFNYQRLLEKLKGKIQQVFDVLEQQHPQISRVFIYGELFGGGYPHPDVEPDRTVKLVQTGVYYSPTIEFYAFDIAICTEETSDNKIYLDYDRALEIFQEVGIFHARPLFVGKFNNACSYPIEFDSTIPAELGLPALSQNPAEGVTIKPLKSIYVETKKGKVRPIIKKKIAAFTEDRRFHQAKKWPDERSPSQEEHFSVLKWEGFNLITENRLQNAISKIGTDYRRQSRQIFSLFIEDILEEISASQSETLASLTPNERNEFTEYLEKEARQLFKGFFKERSLPRWQSRLKIN